MKRLVWIALAIVLLLGAAGTWVFIGTTTPYKGYEAAEQFVEVPPGASPSSIARRLESAGVIRSAVLFRIEIAQSGQGRRLQAGEYRFDQPVSIRDVIAKLARGEVYLRAITFPEGLTVAQMAQVYQSKGFGAASEFAAAGANATLVRDIDPEARDLEGYLFPDTYMLPRRTTAAQLVEKMVAAFQKALTPELRQQAAAHGFGVRKFVTLASIVEKETARPDERPVVAAVYVNRLRIGMGLQCDPTVIYALERAGRYDGNIRRVDLQFDSPYNTYRYAGLPPGPIAAPGRASLEAAANPADVTYLYFVSRNDGSHVFATTLEEHNRNVNEFQRHSR